MKKWKARIKGFLLVFVLLFTPVSVSLCEENEEDWEEYEEEIPESYYYTIESNETPLWPQGPMIEAASAAVLDMDSNAFLYSKNATATMYPASTTKIMTTLLLVENCDLDDEITFSEIVFDLEEGSSHLGIKPGETLTLRDAAYGMMLASANDICNGVAEYLAGSISGFADMMNQKAAELGCVNTHFSNPHGLYAEDHYTCAYDMALIAKAAYENPLFREVATTREYTIGETNLTEEERSFLNHHKMMHSDSEFYQSWCTGGKTGYTQACLNTLVTFAEQDGRSQVSVVFRVNGADKAYQESTQILQYGFDNFYAKKFESNDANRTFYDIMKLDTLGTPEKLQSDVWKRSPSKNVYVELTLPYGTEAEHLSYDLSYENRYGKTFSYKYNDYFVGTASGKFSNIYAPAQMVTERKVVSPVIAVGETTDSTDSFEGVEEVLDHTVDMIGNITDYLVEKAGDNLMMVLAIGICILVLLIIFIVVLIFRCTAESRIRRKRIQEEKDRKKREEEIEQMTTAEIEAELRRVMQEESQRKAEAERAAEEARIMEEKTRETVEMLEELERERQERLAEENKGHE